MKQLTTLLMLMLLPLMASAYDYFKVDGIYYNKLSENAVEVYKDGYKGSVVIPATVKYSGTTYSVTSIGDLAFYECSGLTSVTIPNSVTNIGEEAFRYCSGLTSVNIPNSVTSIGKYTFWGCSGLKSVILPNSVTSIGYGAFIGCSGLTSVNIPNSVTSIGSGAFSSCSGLTSVNIPNSVTNIGFATFQNCSRLTSVTIPNSVTSIGMSAFSDCSGLTSVTIPNSVTSIGSGAFYGTAWYDNRPDGVVYAGKVAYKYKGTMPSNTSIVLQDGTLGIAGEAFKDCSRLTNVTIPNSVKIINTNAFLDCSSLTSVTIGNSVTSIGNSAFYGCSGLTSVTMKNKTPLNISSYTFSSRKQASLYVPFGCKAAYEAADYWREFKEIIELEYEQEDLNDISQAKNVIYVDKTEVRTGLTSTLEVKAKNALAVAGVSFTLELPEGLSLAKDEDEEIVCELAGERAKASKFSVFSADNGDGTYSFRIMPTSTAVINGNDGTLLTVQLQVPETMEAGDYDLRVTDNRFTVKDADTMRTELLPNVLSTLTVSTIEPGDVNGDNELDLTDAIMIVYYSLNLEQAGFNKAVADVNNDGMIDLTDAIIVVYKSLGVQ